MRLRLAAGLLAAGALLAPPATAYESDVHYGLTYWLALQAGFNATQAHAIANGSNRVDSGDMQFLDLSFVYGGLAPNDDSSQQVSRYHYPTAGPVPGPPETRTVIPGSAIAARAIDEAINAPKGQQGVMLFRLGVGLHTLQDSWAHQGVTDTAQIEGDLFKCDPTRFWAHPRARGGFASHKADHTAAWPEDAMAMAMATYNVLLRYPVITEPRTPKDWNQLKPLVEPFVKATTKSDKRAWFAAQGIADASFLEGTSLKDGAQPFREKWVGRKLPPLPSADSRQHYVDGDILDFLNRFFGEWMTTDDLNRLAASVAAAPAERAALGFVPYGTTEIAAQLKLWRMRDHGAVAEMAHAPKRLTARQTALVDAMAKAPDALVRYAAATEAFFPLVTKGKDASPLLPFIVGNAPPSPQGNRRVVATAKLRHAPYDVVAVVAEKVGDRWRIIAFASAVDH